MWAQADHQCKTKSLDVTIFNKTDLDETAGPFRMQVREHPRGGPESRREDLAGVFAVAREFFTRHLR